MEDLTTLTLERIQELVAEAGSALSITDAKFVQVNASDEAQYEVTYWSPALGKNTTNHAFVDIDPDGDTRLFINDFDEVLNEIPDVDLPEE